MLYLLSYFISTVCGVDGWKSIQGFNQHSIMHVSSWFPGIIHAFFVVHEKKADNRMKKQVKMMNQAE